MSGINGHKLFVRSADGQEEWLTCLDLSSFNIDQQLSETFSFTLTAIEDTYSEVSYSLLDQDAKLIYDGQIYNIMQLVGKTVDSQVEKDITATHEIFGIQDFKQFQLKKGLQSYSIDAMLSWIFSSQYNTEGFSYQVIGDFPTVDITDWGNCSGLDAVQKAVDSYGAKWLPNGKTVMIYDKNSYKHAVDKTFRWLHNTNDIQLSVDKTGIKNAAMLYGATIDEQHTTTDGAETIIDSAGVSMDTAPTGSATGTVQTMLSSGIPVYSSPSKKITTGQTLPNGSKWKVDKSVTIDGTIWYRVATNGWVNSKDITFDKDGDVKPENHVIQKVYGQGTIKPSTDSSSDNTTPDNVEVSTGQAIGTISTMNDGGAPVLNDGLDDTGNKLNIGQSYVMTSKKTVNNSTYYKVATGEWVSEKYISFDKDGDVKPEDHTISTVTGQGTIKSDDPVTIYDSPFYPQTKTGATLKNGTQWKIGATVSDGAGGKSYYQVAPGQWVDQSSFDFSGKTDVATSEVANTPFGAKVYDSPWSPQKEANRALATGTSWKIGATVTDGADGKTWYEVAPGQWISSDDITFDGDTDVEPSEDEGKTGEDGDEDDVKYYFTPFFYENQASVSKYGLKTGDDITNDQIKDPQAMIKYADSTLQTDPVVELTVNLFEQDADMKIGDTIFLDASPLGVKTMITLNGVSGNPFINDTPLTVSLDNSSVARTNINFENSDKMRLTQRNLGLHDHQIKKINTKIAEILANLQQGG